MARNNGSMAQLVQHFRRCTRCKREKPLDPNHYYTNAGDSTNFARVCIDCNSEDSLERFYRRMIKKEGVLKFTQRITDLQRRIKLMQRVLKHSMVK